MKIEELKEITKETMSPVVTELVGKAIAEHMEPTNKRLDEARQESKQIAAFMREQYNRGTLTKPFKAISPEAENFIEKIWRPQLKRMQVSQQDVQDYVEKTSTVSIEGTADQGGSILGPS